MRRSHIFYVRPLHVNNLLEVRAPHGLNSDGTIFFIFNFSCLSAAHFVFPAVIFLLNIFIYICVLYLEMIGNQEAWKIHTV